eukprot:CAMPEP_0178398350 /NCGR_PEP_ID=MMETSP0689_2-20121128/14727_1 /TAXON_ID=160604 /ORGANISM="Amphidinium massartii, Strain CS-259" /LENGTH=611 /DNA_ID=CAMNT_0020019109 /DNA_START=50 /DNA_END=1885 /DNA_ORIENTATION=-
MVRPALLGLVCVFGFAAGTLVDEHELAEPRLSKCNREDDGRGPDASIVVVAAVSEDKKSATVAYDLNGLSYSFTLYGRSAFADNAVVTRVSEGGRSSELPSAGRVRTFRVREDDVHARAVVSESGEVRGFFRQGDLVIYLEPSKDEQAGEGVLHNVYLLSGAAASQTTTTGALPSLRGSVSASWNIFESDGATDESWAGNRFYPGCYPGDDAMHSMKLRIVTDVQLEVENPGEVQSLVEAAIFSASYVYENQLNVELLVEELIMYTDVASAPDWAKDCDAHGEPSWMDYKFNNLFDENKENVISLQAFTGCGNGYGWVGVAWLGTTCNIYNGPGGVGRYNYGLNQMNTASAWLIFAHELGHNLDADHAFDEGQGQTGGIMDYNVGGIHEGVVQFNVYYTKTELCNTFTGMGNRCPSDQWFENPATTTAAPTPAPTTAAPTPAPTTAAPTPAPTTAAPTPAPTTAAPTPAPTTAAPTPAPTTAAPTPAPTTAAPTPAPTTAAPTTSVSYPPGGWEVVEGNCVRDAAEPKCLTSPNHPNKYPDGEYCVIQVLEFTTPIDVTFFEVKPKDWMRIDGTKYRRTAGPDGVIPSGDIEWTSNVDGRVRKGWRICREV